MKTGDTPENPIRPKKTAEQTGRPVDKISMSQETVYTIRPEIKTLLRRPMRSENQPKKTLPRQRTTVWRSGIRQHPILKVRGLPSDRERPTTPYRKYH